MKALVLGATGLLGLNLVRALVAQGDEVRAFLCPSNRVHTLKGVSAVQNGVGTGDAGARLREAMALRGSQSLMRQQKEASVESSGESFFFILAQKLLITCQLEEESFHDQGCYR